MTMDPDMAMLFYDFVLERHRIWEKRQAGEPQPWTDDHILAERKFTNVFRVLDPGSQFVFELAPPEDEPRDVLMRLFLYRHTNLPSAWRAYAAETGAYPTINDLDDLLKFWWSYKAGGGKLFSGAYMIYPQSAQPGTEKITSVVELTQQLFLRDRLYTSFAKEESQHFRFQVLRRNKGVADFMSMQIITDWGYTPQCGEDRENEFVVPGPGSKRGLEILWGNNAFDASKISAAQKTLHKLPDAPRLPNGRLPSLMDVQNCFCEFSKYVRYMLGTSTGHKLYSPTHPGQQPDPILPAHWSAS